MTEKRKLTRFEFQSLTFDKVREPLSFQLWEVKRESEIRDEVDNLRIKYFRHDLAAIPVENFSMSSEHMRIAEISGEPLRLPNIYMTELEPEASAVYIEEHDTWLPDNTRFFEILWDGRIQLLDFGLVVHMFKTMHR